MNELEIEKLREWFHVEQRELPWRKHQDPYAVWVSEIMLQQTQVSVVIPYFERWMKAFPTVEDLAKASVDKVIKIWEGLGYYSRARNLHAGACYLLEVHGGKIPDDAVSLGKIKGVGPYTVGAIRSFAFHQKAAAVDGNVIRVLARYFAIEDDIAKPKTVTKLRAVAEEMLPDHEPWVVAEALIELGATVCGRSAQCHKCPVRNSCKAYEHGLVENLPVKVRREKVMQLTRAVAVIYWRDQVLLRQVPEGEVMAGLYEFPYFEANREPVTIEWAQKQVSATLGLDVEMKESLPKATHSFTRYRANLFPFLFKKMDSLNCVHKSYKWHSIADCQNLSFSSGHRKILLHESQRLEW